MEKEKEFYEKLESKGVTRRDFMKYCTALTATMGLSAAYVPKVAEVFAAPAQRPPVVWLHFALMGQRYVPLWVIIVTPTLAQLSCGIPVLNRAAARLHERIPTSARTVRPAQSRRLPVGLSFAIAAALFLAAPWMRDVAAHHPAKMPAPELDRLLQLCGGDRVFHSANWGGYLTWHGRSMNPRFQTWIDDRIEVHGKEHLEEYREILRAKSGWQDKLVKHQVNWLCIPTDVPLADRALESPVWQEHARGNDAVIFRRRPTH